MIRKNNKKNKTNKRVNMCVLLCIDSCDNASITLQTEIFRVYN